MQQEIIAKKHRIGKLKHQPVGIFHEIRIRVPVMDKISINPKLKFSKFRINLRDAMIQKVSINVQTLGQPNEELDSKCKQSKPEIKNKKMCGNFSQFCKQRQLPSQNQNDNRVNLMLCNLSQVVKKFFEEGLMFNFYYARFVNNYKQLDYQQIKSSQQDKKHYNYCRVLFTFIDHRYFSQLLMKSHGDKYKIEGAPNSQDQNLNQFYSSQYACSLQQYYQQWKQFNFNHKRLWMPKTEQEFFNERFFKQFHHI